MLAASPLPPDRGPRGGDASLELPTLRVGGAAVRKAKVKISLPEDLLLEVDRIAEWASASRSATVALLLRGAIGGPLGGPQLAGGVQLGVQLGAPQEGPPGGPPPPHTPPVFMPLDASKNLKRLDDTLGGLGGGGPQAAGRGGEEEGDQPSGQGIPSRGQGSPPAGLTEAKGRPRARRPTRAARGLLCSLSEEAFETWWKAYPRRIVKQAARRGYRSALILCGWSGQARDRETFAPAAEVLLEGAKRYTQRSHGEDPKYVKHPATWLNKACWEDEEEGDEVIAPGQVSANTSQRAEKMEALSQREALERKRYKLQVFEERLEEGETLSPPELEEAQRLRELVGGAC